MKHQRLAVSGIVPFALFLFIFLSLPPGSTDRHPANGAGRPGSSAGGPSASGRLNGDLPFSFEENHGQADPQVRLLARGIRSSVFLTPSEVVLALHRTPPSPGKDRGAAPSVLRMSFAGGNPSPVLIGEEALSGRSHYLLGSDPAQWRTNIPHVAKGRYQAAYPGVDVVFYGSDGHLEFDCIVQPDADPEAVALSFEGAEKLEIDGRGDLRIAVDDGEVRLHKPRVYQGQKASGEEVGGRFKLLSPNSVAFEVAPYDPTRPLVIDPVLSYSTYYGGSGGEGCSAMTEDAAGNIYFCGTLNINNFPTVRPIQPSYGGGRFDAFVAKLNAAGDAIVYATYLGGTGRDDAYQVAADASGNAYLVGCTNSANFPLVNPIQSTFGGSSVGMGDAFLTKLKPDGSGLLFSTYLGGAADDVGMGVAVDGDGNAYIMGHTQSSNFPTKNPYQSARKGLDDAFVSKISSGGALVYSTYLGGGNSEVSYGFGRGNITVDAAGCACVCGFTNSTDFPLANAFQSAYGGGDYVGDVFVTKFNAAGSALDFSTYLGGSGNERAYGIAVAPDGTVGVTGSTRSTNFPTKNAYQGAYGGGDIDAFLAVFNSGGSSLLYSTYLGGSASDSGEAIAVSSDGKFCAVGSTSSPNFPLVEALQSSFGGGDSDAFVSVFDGTGSAPIFSTFLGGDGGESAKGVKFNASGNLALGGGTGSTNFPTVGALQPSYGGGGDSFLARIRLAAPGPVPRLDEIFPSSAAAGDFDLELRVRGENFADGSLVRWDGSNRPTMYESSASLRASISAAILAAGKVVQVTVINPGGSVSNALPFSISNPAPILTVISPTKAIAGGTDINLAVTGSNFVPNSVIRWNSQAKSTTFVSRAELKAAIPAADLATGAQVMVTVHNPAPSGGISSALAFNIADFDISTSPPSIMVSAGQSATYQISLNPTHGSYDTAVSLSCSGMPSACTSSFSSTSVTPGAAGATSTLTLATRSSMASILKMIFGLADFPAPHAGPMLFAFTLVLVLLLPARRAWKQSQRPIGVRLAAAACLVALLAAWGCGSSPEKNAGTPAGSYTVTIEAKAGALSRSTTVSLVVK